METVQGMKQIIDVNKLVIENTMEMMEKSQQQVESIMDVWLENSTRFTNETKQIMDQWTKLTQKGCDDLKAVVDKGLNTVQHLFNLA